MRKWRGIGWVALGLVVVAGNVAPGQDEVLELPPAEKRPVDFATEIRPILEAKCLTCHGESQQKGGLRLDTENGLKAGGDLGPAVEIGKSGESLVVWKVTGFEGESIMPPKGERLSAAEVGLLRAWIDQGAAWPSGMVLGTSAEAPANGHWAFQKPVKPTPPTIKTAWADGVKNPIDLFVRARLEQEGIEPSPEADRRTLIRRVSLDVRGLPPCPDEVGAFVSDPGPNAYEAMVDRMLASPHYGERWGRHWLDLARYADSDGYEKDSPRPDAFRYRDWVIDALNQDMPFDQFTREQLAGDLIPNATEAQRTAAGFHRNTLTNKEGGVDQEEFRVAAVVDRVNTTATVWLGLTMACAQCHTHKYDPILQREYYQMFAFFNTADEVDVPTMSPEERAVFEREQEAFERERSGLSERLQAYLRDELPARQAVWEGRLSEDPTDWKALKVVEVTSANGSRAVVEEDGSVWLEAGPDAETVRVIAETELPGITGIRLEVMADDRLPGRGPGRSPAGNFVLNEFRVKAGERFAPEEPFAVELFSAKATFSQNDWDVAGAMDGDPKSGWAVSPKFGRDHAAVFETSQDLGTEYGTRFEIELEQIYGKQHTIGRFRLLVTNAERPLTVGDVPADVRRIASKAPEVRTRAESKRMAEFFASIDGEAVRLRAALKELEARGGPKAPASRIRTFQEQTGTPRSTHVLMRGDFQRPGDPVEAGTPAVLHAFEAHREHASRLDLTDWLMDPENPLTARVAVNRVWGHLFGRSIVATPEDFGVRGEAPSHPELLDWLAATYRELGWSQKRLIRLILTSATYRQSSGMRPELLEEDPSNMWLARQSRIRLEAEVVRDASLAAAGLLEPKVGGPSVRPPQPPGISELTYANSAKWVESEGADRYRRGLYTWFQRTSPYPMLTTFDAADGNVCTVKRERSNTPLQALTLLNDAVFVECAQAMACRIVTESDSADVEDRARRAYEVALNREPTDRERELLLDLHDDLLAVFEKTPEEARRLAGNDCPEAVSEAEMAGWVAVSRTLLNLDEFLNRE